MTPTACSRTGSPSGTGASSAVLAWVIANATPMLNAMAGTIAFSAANAWMLSSFGGLVNAIGGVGTGHYSDRIGRANAYLVNGVISASCRFLILSIQHLTVRVVSVLYSPFREVTPSSFKSFHHCLARALSQEDAHVQRPRAISRLSASGNRSIGSFARQRRTTASRSAGTSSRICDGGTTGSRA